MRHLLLLFLIGSLFPLPLPAAVDFDSLAKDYRETLKTMVAADTESPPGNEARIVRLVAERLKAENIAYEISEFAPGRQNIVARLKGTGEQRPVLLLAHIDVVGTQNQKWSTDPHVLIEREGYLYGRGAGDDLGMAAANLEIFLLLKREGVPLRRDVILALTGDEESGGAGIRYLLKTNPASVDAEIVLNEGGGLVLNDKGTAVKYIGLQVAEKTYQDFELRAKGTSGHASVPLPDNAIYRMARALTKLGQYQWPARLLPVSREFFRERADFEPLALQAAMKKIAMAQGALPKSALREIDKNPALAATLRTTCVATTIAGGNRVNALPAAVEANINCRILPDESLAEVIKNLRKAIGDEQIEIVPVGEFSQGGMSTLKSDFVDSLKRAVKETMPGVPVIPFLARGATDSRYLRTDKRSCYGIHPIAQTEFDSRRAHGIDERIPVASIRPGLEFFHKLVLDLTAKAPQG